MCTTDVLTCIALSPPQHTHTGMPPEVTSAIENTLRQQQSVGEGGGIGVSVGGVVLMSRLPLSNQSEFVWEWMQICFQYCCLTLGSFQHGIQAQ